MPLCSKGTFNVGGKLPPTLKVKVTKLLTSARYTQGPSGLAHATGPTHLTETNGLQGSSAARQQPEDLAFFRALDFGILSIVSISYCSVALLALGAIDARIAVVAGLLLATAGR